MASELNVGGITTTGNVGVGASPDDHRLVVRETASDEKVLELSSANGSCKIDFSRNGDPTAFIKMFEDGASGTGALLFGTGTSVTPTTRLTISSAGLATFSNGIKSENGIYGGQITIADDAVGSITPPRQAGIMTLSYNANADYPSHWASLLYCDVGLSLYNIVLAGGATAVNTDVTGTTGANGATTVGGVVAAGTGQVGTIKIENRSSGSVTYWYNFIG